MSPIQTQANRSLPAQRGGVPVDREGLPDSIVRRSVEEDEG